MFAHIGGAVNRWRVESLLTERQRSVLPHLFSSFACLESLEGNEVLESQMCCQAWRSRRSLADLNSISPYFCPYSSQEYVTLG